MKIILMSMPDVAAVIMHESAFHMPNCGIASVGANIDEGHEVYIVDLIRQRRRLKAYLIQTLLKIRPGLVGLSAMSWQYATCVKIIRLIKRVLPETKVLIGGYHATLMYEEIAASPDAGLIDFVVRGEGEEACRRLVNALEGRDRLGEIPSLSYKVDGRFVHNPRGELLDLARLKRPIRDRRRLTWGYHIMNSKVEVMETSRGCTRSCNFCSINHMYGKSFRTYPVERVLEDLDEIYHKLKTRWVFIVDDNLVLDVERVMGLCDAIIARRYHKLQLIVQADCISISRNEEMVRKMSRAGMKTMFLGIENASKKNLAEAGKGNIVEASRKAVQMCHKHGIMVVAGLISGFPNDDEQALIENYDFLKTIDADSTFCQILTPYPKTVMRRHLIDQGLVTNMHDYRWYNGMWANVRTKHLDTDQLQYLFWYHRQQVLGWWEPPERVRSQGPLWTAIWVYLFRPIAKILIGRSLRKYGWRGRYERVVKRLARVNAFPELN